MKSLRSIRLRANLLPLVLFALVLRSLIPIDAMAGAGMSVKSSMCSTRSGRSEVIEIPAGESSPQHCEQCFAPSLGAPAALPRSDGLVRAALPQPRDDASQIAEKLLARAQSARAPPYP
ncbi:MAG TPA: hypothetical protein VGO61_19060 [Steroidobacteraceae bacterium]|nr:hypothetical protein [Steroidobacteraceae bacterium]